MERRRRDSRESSKNGVLVCLFVGGVLAIFNDLCGVPSTHQAKQQREEAPDCRKQSITCKKIVSTCTNNSKSAIAMEFVDFEMRGVKLKLLRAIANLAQQIGGEWTVGRISNVLLGAHEILKAGHRWGADVDKADTLTFVDQMSLIDVLKTHYKDASSPHPTLGVCYDDVVGEQATKFCSFAYNGDFFELVDSLEALILANPEYADEYFWFDMLVNNQWFALDHDFDWWASTFKTAVKKIGHLVLICSPWSDPEPLKRAWCLWEIYCAIGSGGKFDVALGTAQHDAFVQAIIADPAAYYKMLGNIDVEKSNCWLSEDKENIFHAVESSIGFTELNTMVIGKMRDWVRTSLNDKINKTTAIEPREHRWDLMLAKGILLENTGEYSEAMTIYQECLVEFADIEDAIRIGKNLYGIGVAYFRQGNSLRSIEVFEECLTVRVQALGEFHKDVGDTINNLAVVFRNQGENHKALKYYEKALAVYIQTLGETHPSVAQSYNNMGVVFERLGEYHKAMEYNNKCLAIRLKTLGNVHPDIASTYYNIASLFYRNKDYIQAIEFNEKCLAIRLKTLGNIHPSVAVTFNNMASVYYSQGNIKKALEFFEKTLFIQSKALGDGHPHTKITLEWIEECASIVKMMP